MEQKNSGLRTLVGVEACVSKKQWIFEYHIDLTNKILLSTISYSKKNNSNKDEENQTINCTTLFISSFLFKF